MNSGDSATAIHAYDSEANELSLPQDATITKRQFGTRPWRHQGHNGYFGYFPAKRVELIAETSTGDADPQAENPASPLPQAPGPSHTGTALYEYKAAENGEPSFPEGATVTIVEYPHKGW